MGYLWAKDEGNQFFKHVPHFCDFTRSSGTFSLKAFYTSDQLRSAELVSFIFSCNFHVSSAGLAFSNFSYINLLLLIKTHFYTKGEMSNFYLKESMFYIPVQDVDMFSTIHPKPKTFRERLKNKFCLVQTSNQFKSKEQSKSSWNQFIRLHAFLTCQFY